MNRIEFMSELDRLLKNISAEERAEAIQYYQDYFEDAGIENEAQIIEELGSPQRVAQTIREGLRGRNDDSSEYRETGYTDTRFERRDDLANRYDYSGMEQKQAPKKNNLLKVVLIAAIILLASPVILPVALGILATVFALAVSGFAILGSLLIVAVCIVFAGVITSICGFVKIFASPGLGLIVCGAGLLIGVFGAIGTVLLFKLCMIVFPALFKGIVNLFRRLFHRKGAI